jgi:hypothetical protein
LSDAHYIAVLRVEARGQRSKFRHNASRYAKKRKDAIALLETQQLRLTLALLLGVPKIFAGKNKVVKRIMDAAYDPSQLKWFRASDRQTGNNSKTERNLDFSGWGTILWGAIVRA